MTQHKLTWECYELLGDAPQSDWRRSVEAALDRLRLSYGYDIRGHELRVWRKDQAAISVSRSKLRYQDAIRIRRMPPMRTAVGVRVGFSAARLYFEEGGVSPLPYSAAELLAPGAYPSALKHQNIVPLIDRLVKALAETLTLSRVENFSVDQVSDQLMFRSANGSVHLNELLVGNGLSKNLLEFIRKSRALRPIKASIGVALGFSRDNDAALEIARHTCNVLADWGCDVALDVLGATDCLERFVASRPDGLILVPIEGKRGTRPEKVVLDWLRYMNEEKRPFQLSSISSNPLYSRHGLAMATLQKLGGSLYEVQSGPTEIPLSWYVGIDVGYGGGRTGRIAAITLCDEQGRLHGFWRCIKSKTEALSGQVLQNGIHWVLELASKLDASKELIFIRDGICPASEREDLYRRALGDQKCLLVEYVKHGNPLIHREGAQAPAGSVILPEGDEFAHLSPCQAPQKGVFANATKFRLRINDHRITNTDMAHRLVLLCHVPTLSYQPSAIPAPVQWANGICKLSNTDLQFSGWGSLPSHTQNLV